jgi:hypothetical protein
MTDDRLAVWRFERLTPRRESVERLCALTPGRGQIGSLARLAQFGRTFPAILARGFGGLQMMRCVMRPRYIVRLQEIRYTVRLQAFGQDASEGGPGRQCLGTPREVISKVPEPDLTKYVGGVVSRVRQLKYEFGGNIDSEPNEGTVELIFEDGSLLLCKSRLDGETVVIGDRPWIDPFAPPLSPENEEFVRTCGKLTRYDVSDTAPFADLIGRKLENIAVIAGTKRYGLVLNVSGYLLALYAGAEELRIQLMPASANAPHLFAEIAKAGSLETPATFTRLAEIFAR